MKSLVANPYFILASSQLFPTIPTSIVNLESELKEYTIAQQAYEAFQRGAYKHALEIYSQAITDFPDLPYFYICRSLLNDLLGDEEGSFYDYQVAKSLDFNYHLLQEWKENAGEMVESTELEEFSVKTNDSISDTQLYINRATLLAQHFNYQEAIDDLSVAISQTERADYLISRAAIYMRMVKYDSALQDLNNAILLESEAYNGYLFRGQLYKAIHEFELAIQDFNQCISLDPNNPSIYEERAQFYDSLGHYEQAIEDYTLLIGLLPEDFYPYVMRAEIFEKISDWKNALGDFDQAIRLNPHYSDLYQYRGEIKQKLGDMSGAKQDFNKFEEMENE